MGLLSNIKKAAAGNNTKIQTSEAADLEKIFNKMFYLQKNPKEEVKFVEQVITRGLESQERVGLHASAFVKSEKDFCIRAQVLSLIYKQLQGEQIAVNLKRIFEEGNAIHEKWQRLFIRAGYGKAEDMDLTQYDEEYMISYTPDVICLIPEFFKGKMIGEIKSVNTFQFKKMVETNGKHASAWKQLQWYMHLNIKREKDAGTWNGIDYTKGFVLCEDKNNQDFRLEIYEYDPSLVASQIEKAESVTFYHERVFSEKKMVARPDGCDSPSCKRCSSCVMREACWNIGKGKQRIEQDW